jgi:hypothetical protein
MIGILLIRVNAPCEILKIETLTFLQDHDPPKSLDDALSMMFEAVSDGIERMDVGLCSVFTMVHDEARYELGLA